MKDLIKQLKQMGLTNSDKVLIHSSLRHINRDPNTVVDALLDYFNEGLVLMPTHTWAQMGEDNTFFDPDVEPSCVGLLTEVFRNREGVIRSIHPTHSMAGFGKDAKEYLANDLAYANTPCTPKGTWGRLGEIGAKIMLIGCDMTRNTFVHAVEEIADIPERFSEYPIKFQLKTPNGVVEKEFYKHGNPFYNHLSMNYKIAEKPLIDLGIITVHQLGDAKVLLMDAYKLQKQVLKWLEIDEMVFSTDIKMNPILAKVRA